VNRIQSILHELGYDEVLDLKVGRTGNTQLVFKSLKDTSDEDKCRVLVAVADAMKAVGLPIELRLSVNFGTREEPRWGAFPHIWVNEAQAVAGQSAAVSAEVAELRQQMAELVKLLGKQSEAKPAETRSRSRTRKPAATPESEVLVNEDIPF
jgi:hypothetical protein